MGIGCKWVDKMAINEMKLMEVLRYCCGVIKISKSDFDELLDLLGIVLICFWLEMG